jgi:hypothetical protein
LRIGERAVEVEVDVDVDAGGGGGGKSFSSGGSVEGCCAGGRLFDVERGRDGEGDGLTRLVDVRLREDGMVDQSGCGEGRLMRVYGPR